MARLPRVVTFSPDDLLGVLAKEGAARCGLANGGYHFESTADIDDNKKIHSLTLTIDKERGES